MEKAIKLSRIILKLDTGKDKADFQKLNWEEKVASMKWSEEENESSGTITNKRVPLKVYELSEKLYVTSKEIVLFLRDKGYLDVRNMQSILSEEEEIVRREFSRRS